jgi:NTP pyrophosphatase (non-canonical NTP hydrolase)
MSLKDLSKNVKSELEPHFNSGSPSPKQTQGLDDIQKQVDEWVKQFNPPYWPALEQLARLTEETGEVARELNHLHGTKKKKSSEETKELSDELVDVIFTVICLANSHKINLDEAWKKMVDEKMNKRDVNRFEKKEDKKE